jgi:hypothetical protein
MRPLATLALATVVLAAPAALAAPPSPPPTQAARDAAGTISAPRCRAHVDFLASDLLEGRATPSRGLDVAGAYIVSQFERCGLEPGGEGGSWFQPFPVLREVRLAESALAAGEKTYEYKKDYIPFPFTGTGRAAGPLVFAGYGITREKYDDYAGIDARGKIVLVLRHEPREKGRRLTKDALFATKVENAAKHGAVGLLLVTDPVNHKRTAPEGKWPNFGEGGETAPIPAFHVSLEAASALLGGRDLKAIETEIDEKLEPRSFAVDGPEVALAAKVERLTGEGRNVVAVLRGSDPALAGEAVVLGAHYDHVGTDLVPGDLGLVAQRFPRGSAAGDDHIWNGADDNASGTSALIEVARAFAESPLRPRRTLVFVAFAGEELGLLGSQHYVAHPVVPIARTVAMLNLDMVGRNAPDELFVGGKADRALADALEAANGVVGLKTKPITDEEIGGSSDHESFETAKVPTLFFFSGDHPDYHRVSDEASKIVPEKIARVARLAFLTAANVAEGARAGEVAHEGDSERGWY